MALPDILSAIDEKTAEDIADLQQDWQAQESALKAEYDKKIHARKEEILKNLKAGTNRKISQASFQVQSQINSKVLTKKREIIDQVFEKALAKMQSLSEAEQQKLIAALIKKLPQVEKGEIVPVSGSESVVKKAAQAAGSKYSVSSETMPGKGGFIFKSEGLVIDNSWENIISREKDQSETDIANILFYG